MSTYFLYKYAKIDATTISNLVNEVIYFSHVDRFNDPTDSAFTILTAGDGTENPNLLEDLKSVCKFTGVKYLIEPKEEERSLALIQISKQLEAALKKYVGICCFSGHKKCTECGCPRLNPLMLSHYACGHAGIIIEYECLDPNLAHDMKYEASSHHYNYLEIMKGFNPQYNPIKSLKITPQIIEPLLFKFKQWEYEEEKRIFSAPETTKKCSDLKLKVKSIYFGIRVAQDISDSLKLILDKREINFYYLGLPISHQEKQSVIIHSDWVRGNRLNRCQECIFDSP